MNVEGWNFCPACGAELMLEALRCTRGHKIRPLDWVPIAVCESGHVTPLAADEFPGPSSPPWGDAVHASATRPFTFADVVEAAEAVARAVPSVEVVAFEFEPWLLGFCRWRTVERTIWGGLGNGEVAMGKVLAQGRWRWRGRSAQYREWVNRSPNIFNKTGRPM